MILCIIAGATLLVGIALCIICSTIESKPFKNAPDWLSGMAGGYMMVGVLSMIIVSCFLLINFGRTNIDYEEALYEKEVLEYRLDQFDEEGYVTGNELLYQEITAFNNSIRRAKRLSNSAWINWFVNKKIATIEYIDYTNGGN